MADVRRCIAFSLAAFGLALPALACIWDRDSLAKEKGKSPKMAAIILGSRQAPPDPKPLLARIETLKAHPEEKSVAWWNDLAGAYLRLGKAAEAVRLLEPVVKRFPNDYGIHANLGTAYHLLGRYREAEKEIARDLEINPDGHFGLERYHLALLRYLMRDDQYKKTHVYVDELTPAFFAEWDLLLLMPRTEDIHPKLAEGAIYMASLNPNEPACFVLLGIVCLQGHGYDRDLNLAAAAFEKAIRLGSPQKSVLTERIQMIRKHIGGG